MVKNAFISIETVQDIFDDNVSKVKRHGPDFEFVESRNKAVPMLLILCVLSPAKEHGCEETDSWALELTKVLWMSSDAVIETEK